MPADFAAMLATMKEEAHEPSEATAFTRHIVSALRYYRPKRFRFSEKTFSFSTVAGQQEYNGGVGGVPADVMELDWLRHVIGTVSRDLQRKSLIEFRVFESGAIASNYPEIFCWHHNRLLLWPTPAGVYTVKGDYFFDATRDGATGVVIDGTNTALTNDYFAVAEELLRTRALYSWAMGRAGWDEFATRMKLLNTESERSFNLERDLIAFNGMQAAWNL